jgi:hypothetical protein
MPLECWPASFWAWEDIDWKLFLDSDASQSLLEKGDRN